MKIPHLLLIFAVSFCVFIHKPCDKVTDDDIIGVCVSCNSANTNRQYIEIFEGGSYGMSQPAYTVKFSSKIPGTPWNIAYLAFSSMEHYQLYLRSKLY
jgi:hypothetical protein